jgi:hypothetical protein
VETEVLDLMATRYPIVRDQVIGEALLRGNTHVTIDDFVDTDTQFGIEIQFFSPSGDLVGSVGTSYFNSQLLSCSFKVRKLGGLESFNIEISRDVEIPFFNGMETRIHVYGILWYTGQLIYTPGQDRRNVSFPFEGKGYKRYLKDVVINNLYTSETLEDILKDIIENDLAANTEVLYNPDKIEPPNITVTKLELNDKSVEKAVNTILQIANYQYNTAQYYWGVDEDREFFFKALPTDDLYGFFEGWQYQTPETEDDINNVINKVNIYRSQENSDVVEFVVTVEDTTSQAKYGLRYKKITIADFVDSTEATKIAQAIIEEFKEPKIRNTISELIPETTPYDFGKYLINNRKIDYFLLVNDFEDLSLWDLSNISNTTITLSSNKVWSGKKAFRVETTSGSSGEYIELTLDEPVYFVDFIRLYVYQDITGNLIDIDVYDVDGVREETIDSYLAEEDYDKILLENGTQHFMMENGAVDLYIPGDYIEVRKNIDDLDNIKRIRITFKTNEDVLLFLDRLDFKVDSYKQNNLVLEEIEYIFERASFKANASFGNRVPTLIDDIQELNEKTTNVIDIFQKQ